MRPVDIEIRRLDGSELRADLDGLARVLEDCVAGGASISYMAPFSHDDALAAFEGFAAEVEQHRRLLLAAYADGEVVGTVQVILSVRRTNSTAGRSPSSSCTVPHAGAASRNC